ncbi:hypothetical protein B0T17DRAFT_505672 [Bombardia bombarda]|uniref:VHS domain-containing protein n=1 Tax=Bombardia bombarda TaxID=252184 RepID=A0AA40C917_9PEZI|nr:hypothetical protein B0T17DRAFT_505672 [Bombardia bombarda]
MFSQKKPYTAVTVTIERLTSEDHAENDLSGIPDLVEVVNIQESGPKEAARAIRKKLKYGNLHRQLRALTLLDALIQNAGSNFQRNFANEPLLERLRFCATANLSDQAVKKKCAELFRSWAVEYKSTAGMGRVSLLYDELPKRKHVVTQEKSKVIKETANPFGDDDDEEETPSPAGPSTAPQASASRRTPASPGYPGYQSSNLAAKDKEKKEKKSRHRKPFNPKTEMPHVKSDIAEASIAAINLTNTLQSINREKERISENETAVRQFEECKRLRKKILRYIHHIDDDKWLGGLLHANDELVTALMTFEQLDRSIDADSDSDDDVAEQAHLYRMATEKAKGKEPNSPTSPNSGGAPPQPPRPFPPPRPSAATKPKITRVEPSDDENSDEDDEDENDPFADRNAVSTPKMESDEPKWSRR